MKFPLDNRHRRAGSSGARTGAIHDSTGKIVIQVLRVNLPQEPGESFADWKKRETEATVSRASAVVRLLNAGYEMVRAVEKHAEQLWLPGVEKDEDIREEDRK